MINLSEKWQNLTFVAFDTETSGAYPLSADICEIGAVKWQSGKIIEEFHTLLKPKELMSDFIIGIHGITNEMVSNAPRVEDKIKDFYDFIQHSVVVAHHAPFDLGFIAIEFEKAGLKLPEDPALCSSLLSRKLIPEAPRHKLQILIQHLKLHQGQAHRASDDAKACFEVALHCFQRAGAEATLEDLIKLQGKKLYWIDYSILGLKQKAIFQPILAAIENKSDLHIVYDGGSQKGKTRQIKPLGIVRNPDGDYLMALCYLDHTNKRFYLNRITDASF